MRIRILFGLVVLIGLTAFAPAPFMKPDRRRDRAEGDMLTRLQGTWTIASKTRMGVNGMLTRYSTTTQKLQIEKDAWQFVSAGVRAPAVKGVARILYKLEIEAGQPRKFRVVRTTNNRDYMVGIVGFEGDTCKMLYKLAASRPGDEQMPLRFDPVPEGWYLMTLKRDK